jgi:predicted nucleotidyltransferase
MLERDFFAILVTLHRHEVDFILVGELAAAVNGVDSSTLDVDIVHSRDAANVERLLTVLESLDAIFRIQAERRIKPNASYVSGPSHLHLITRFGPLDVLGTIGHGLTYADLLPHSVEMDIGDGIRVRVLDLETLISLKEDLGTEKDRAMLPLLRQTLEEQRRRERPVC